MRCQCQRPAPAAACGKKISDTAGPAWYGRPCNNLRPTQAAPRLRCTKIHLGSGVTSRSVKASQRPARLYISCGFLFAKRAVLETAAAALARFPMLLEVVEPLLTRGCVAFQGLDGRKSHGHAGSQSTFDSHKLRVPSDSQRALKKESHGNGAWSNGNKRPIRRGFKRNYEGAGYCPKWQVCSSRTWNPFFFFPKQ